MDKETLRKVQLAQLEIAKDIRRVCEENGIRYFLDSGSLLGAVRHRGFIPWDDDMDIGMLRQDYEKFLQIAQEALGSQYFVQTWDTDPNYPQPFAKVRKNGTRYVEQVAQKTGMHSGLYVDVLPFDAFPDDKKALDKMKRKINFYYRLLYLQVGMTPWIYGKSLVRKTLIFLKNLPFLLIGKVMKRETIKKKYMAVMIAYNTQNTKYVDIEMGRNSGSHRIPRNSFQKWVKLPFEDEQFDCPVGYADMLTAYYGNYMQLPPEDKRGTHGIIEVEL